MKTRADKRVAANILAAKAAEADNILADKIIALRDTDMEEQNNK